MTHLVVLAGGFGTRLRSAVADVPKPLAPVGGRPFLHFLIDNWLQQGVTRMTYLLHHQAALVQNFLQLEDGAGRLGQCRVESLAENRPMGTGGAIAYAVRQLGIDGSFLVANADTWLGTGIAQVASVAAPAIGTVQVPDTARYGKVEVAQDKAVAFTEKQDSAGAGWINAGLYHLPAELFRDWDGEPFSLESVVFPKLAAAGRLRVVPLQTDFIDIGVPEDYYRFGRWIDSKKTGVL